MALTHVSIYVIARPVNNEVFNGTEVKIATFVEYMEWGKTVEEFIADFPDVRREDIQSFSEFLGGM